MRKLEKPITKKENIYEFSEVIKESKTLISVLGSFLKSVVKNLDVKSMMLQNRDFSVDIDKLNVLA